MARRYRKKTTRRPRRMVRRTRRRTVRKTRIPNAFPKMITRNMIYTQEITMNAAASSYATYTFRANSLYDPDYTSTGHQPYGFDETMNVYYNYSVDSSYIRVKRIPNAVSDGIPAYIAIVRSNSSTAPAFTAAEQFLEYCRYNGSKPILIGSFTQDMGPRPAVAKLGWRYKKQFIGSGKDTNNWGTSATNPFLEAYFHVICFSVYADDPAAFPLQVDMGFRAKFFTQKMLAMS